MLLKTTSLLDAKLAREALNGPIAILVTDALGGISWCNASAENLFSTSFKEMQGYPVTHLLQNIETSSDLPAGFRKIKLSNEQVCHVLHQVVQRPIGQAHYFTSVNKLTPQLQTHLKEIEEVRSADFAINLFKEHSSQLDRVQKAADAVRLEAEESDRKAKTWWSALETVGHGVWSRRISYDGDIAVNKPYIYSQHWFEMRGVEIEQGEPSYPDASKSRIHPEDYKSISILQIRQASGMQDNVTYEYRERHALGHWIWILAKGRVVEKDQLGRPTLLIGVDIDISSVKAEEKSRQEEAQKTYEAHLKEIEASRLAVEKSLLSAKTLAESETIWRTAVLATGHGVWCYDVSRNGKKATTTVNFCSDAWYEMRGAKPGAKEFDEIEYWYERIHPDDLENAILNIDKQVNGADDEVSFEYREKHSAGHWMWILVRGKTVERDANGYPQRVIGIDIDISDIKAEAARHADEVEYRHQIHITELRSATLLAEQAQAEAQLMARIDSQTKLANRHMFREDISTLIGKCEKFAVLIVDLDRFRKINDLHGHAAGDFVLKEAARRLSAIVGANGIVARLGGDEFAILLAHFEQDLEIAVDKLAENIIEQLSVLFINGDLSLQLGATIGSAQYPKDGENYEKLILHADMALIQAKGSSRGVHTRYTDAMGEEATKRTKLENDLRTAIAEKQIQTWFQPILSAETNKVVKFEVLARWRHPLHGFISPETFISMAEYLGLLPQLSIDLLQQALDSALNWNGIKLSFNMTAHEASDVHTPLRILSTLNKTSFDPSRLEIEITEQAFLDDMQSAQTVVESLRKVGIKVYIDDFGEGYAGIGYLRDFEVDGIKFDRSCVTNICTKASSANFLKSLQLMASNMNLETVAEGIETSEVWEMVKQLGCSYGQGYIFSKALPANEVSKFLAKQSENRSRLIA